MATMAMMAKRMVLRAELMSSGMMPVRVKRWVAVNCHSASRTKSERMRSRVVSCPRLKMLTLSL